MHVCTDIHIYINNLLNKINTIILFLKRGLGWPLPLYWTLYRIINIEIAVIISQDISRSYSCISARTHK